MKKLHFAKSDNKPLCGRKKGRTTDERDYITCTNCKVKIVQLEDVELTLIEAMANQGFPRGISQ